MQTEKGAYLFCWNIFTLVVVDKQHNITEVD